MTGVVLIAGPTASGKSAAALALAQATGGEIVNADAMQVYRDLLILTARPGPADAAAAPHHLFGHVDAAERYSTGRWARAARAAIADITGRGRTAIVVGGTGLYFRALEGGLAEIPEIPETVRADVAARLAALGPAAFRAELLAVDPGMAALDPADRQRHIRAFEVFAATGKPLSAWQAEGRGEGVLASARLIIEPPRAALYARIEQRFDAMMAAGALDEARGLAARRLDPALPAMKAVGAAELMAHLRGEISLPDAVALAKQNSRRLAKRQMTWFRRQAPDWASVESEEGCMKTAHDLRNSICFS